MLFFGGAALAACRAQNWLYAVFWLVIGAFFVLLSRRNRIFPHH
jgi:hypothetical protein